LLQDFLDVCEVNWTQPLIVSLFFCLWPQPAIKCIQRLIMNEILSMHPDGSDIFLEGLEKAPSASSLSHSLTLSLSLGGGRRGGGTGRWKRERPRAGS